MSFRPLVTQCSDGHTPAECARVMADLGRDRRRRQLRAGPGADAAAAARNAGRGECADRRAAGRLPHDRRVPFVHAAAGSFPTIWKRFRSRARRSPNFGRIAESEGIRYVGGCCGCNAAYIRVARTEPRRHDPSPITIRWQLDAPSASMSAAPNVPPAWSLLPEGRVLARRLQPTQPDRGGDAVLADVVNLMLDRCSRRRSQLLDVNRPQIGSGRCRAGERRRPGAQRSHDPMEGCRASAKQFSAETGLPVYVDADVRAAARGEAAFRRGREFRFVSLCHDRHRN